jgi:hypothetical protein
MSLPCIREGEFFPNGAQRLDQHQWVQRLSEFVRQLGLVNRL